MRRSTTRSWRREAGEEEIADGSLSLICNEKWNSLLILDIKTSKTNVEILVHIVPVVDPEQLFGEMRAEGSPKVLILHEHKMHTITVSRLVFLKKTELTPPSPGIH